MFPGKWAWVGEDGLEKPHRTSTARKKWAQASFTSPSSRAMMPKLHMMLVLSERRRTCCRAKGKKRKRKIHLWLPGKAAARIDFVGVIN